MRPEATRALCTARGTRGALRSLALGNNVLGPQGAEAIKGYALYLLYWYKSTNSDTCNTCLRLLLKNPALGGLDLNQSGISGTGGSHFLVQKYRN
jgi:hypothetical protein